jgi:hypothetical protein
VESASDVVLGRDADVFETTGVEFNTRFAEDLVDDLVAVKVEDGETVGLSDLIHVVGGDEASRAGHVLDHYRRIAGDVFAHVARN